jgi:hypothetical protein
VSSAKEERSRGRDLPYEAEMKSPRSGLLFALAILVAAAAARPALADECRGDLLGLQRGLRAHRAWKYIETSDIEGVVEELYDLAVDPYELENLAFDPTYQVPRTLLARRLAELREP